MTNNVQEVIAKANEAKQAVVQEYVEKLKALNEEYPNIRLGVEVHVRNGQFVRNQVVVEYVEG